MIIPSDAIPYSICQILAVFSLGGGFSNAIRLRLRDARDQYEGFFSYVDSSIDDEQHVGICAVAPVWNLGRYVLGTYTS